jgi:hypothetical protein
MHGISTSVCKMGPGMHSDYIDSFMGHQNWCKHIAEGTYLQQLGCMVCLTVLLGYALAHHLLKTIPKAKEFDAEFVLLNTTISNHDSSVLATWELQYEMYIGGDWSGVCLFETEDVLISM